jgi:hypothetical protein
MTFDDVRCYGRTAFLPLPNGALLHYQPDDGRVRVLSHRHRPGQWDLLPILDEGIPPGGWQHLVGCGCSRCRPDGFGVR